MKYVLLFCDDADWEQRWEAMDQAERDHRFAQVEKWLADNSDKVTHTCRLRTPQTATTVRLVDDGEPLVTDGPFVEGKEVISGYTEVDVADLDEALRMAKTWPACPIVEIRPAL